MTFDDALHRLTSPSPLRITLSGDIGSGKSTFGKHLAEALTIPRIYIGGLMREEAKKRGITLDAFNAMLQTDETIDREMDAMQTEVGRQTPRGIFEGRTSWYFIENPDARVYLSVREEVGAERVWGDEDNSARDTYASLEAVKEANQKRKQSEIDRYQRYYNIDVYNHDNYDIVIDTSERTIDEVYRDTVIAIAEWLEVSG